MPRNRRYNARRGRSNRPRRRYNSNMNFTYGNVVDKLTKDVSKMMGLLNTEFKAIDIANSGTVSTTAGFVLLNGSAPGDDFDTRDGRQVRIKSIQITLTYFQHSSAVVTQIRAIVFLDKQPNETTPTVTELLDTATMVSFRNLNFRKRFVILRDEVFTMSDSGSKMGIWKYYKQIDAKTVFDAGTAGTIADITTNAIFLMLLSTEATNLLNVTRVSRIRFIDN